MTDHGHPRGSPEETATGIREGTALVEDVWCDDDFGDELAAFPELLDTVLAAEQLVRTSTDYDDWRRAGESMDAARPDVSIQVPADEPGDAYLTLDYDVEARAYRVDRVDRDAVPTGAELGHGFHDYVYRLQEYDADHPDDGDPAAEAYALVRAWQTKPDPTSVGLLEIDVAVTRH